MNKLLPIVLLTSAVSFSIPAIAAGGHDMSHGKEGMHAANNTAAQSEGTVKKIDKTNGKITINHGPLQNLGMPAMTMSFKASSANMLDQVKPGEKVRFTAENIGGVLTVTAIDNAG